ncbi:Thermosome subunit beta (Fragment) [Seminavis robusta]|uniref:CCT-beta n=1 Tax=Seminavis robusta TaxID=568900 RepID=A0A9N8EZV0_9STRA
MEQAYLGQGTSVDKGENARLSSYVGAIAIADLVKTTLGPKGLDKMLQKVDPANSHGAALTVTNDGATILRSIHIDNAAAKVLVDIAKVQDEQVGDGTTSVAVLSGELLRQAETLEQEYRLHPQTMAAGWRLARGKAREALEQHANEMAKRGGEGDEAFLRANLLRIAETTLSSKMVTYEKKHFARLAVDAVMRLSAKDGAPRNLNLIQVLKKPGGSLKDSYLEEGFLLDLKSPGIGQPRRVENAKILLANTSMDTDKIKMYGSRVKVDRLDKVAEIERAEKDKMKDKVEKILKHNANVFINRQLIYNYPESIFAEHGIMAIEHADFEGIERLAAVTGGEVASTFDHPELVKLGECDVIEEIFIGEDKILRFGGCKVGEACTIVLRGASTHVLEEAERSLHDALCILLATLEDPRVICGGGCTEVLMAQAIDRAVEETPGKQALAMAAFAKALRALPAIVADNGGYDSAELITQLRAAHAQGKSTYGLDMYNGTIADMTELGVLESYKSKFNVLMSASEAAEMIVRVDDIIKCAPRQREERYPGMGM